MAVTVRPRLGAVRSVRRAGIAAALLALLLGSRPVAALIAADPEPIRPFGYTIGDMVQQTLHLKPAPGQALVEESLPRVGRAGPWFIRRAVAATPERGGWRIELRYQFINAPTEVGAVALPALRLQLREGSGAEARLVEEFISELPLGMAPLTAAVVRRGADGLRPDTSPPLIDTRPWQQRLWLYGLLAGLIGLPWLAWYLGFGLRGRRARPFAQAERELRRLLRGDAALPARRQAMRSLHRAFDATAGQTVLGESLAAFLDTHPALAPARDAVTRFFAASAREFFAFGDAAEILGAAELLALAARLKSLEREAR